MNWPNRVLVQSDKMLLDLNRPCQKRATVYKEYFTAGGIGSLTQCLIRPYQPDNPCKQYLVRWAGHGTEDMRWLAGAELAEVQVLDTWLASKTDGQAAPCAKKTKPKSQQTNSAKPRKAKTCLCQRTI
ncbi:hypothetical protein C8R44DRAFT_726678 [Mycena epipterygia]|nr:hypothetical protein C8R44DRAFT_726678 [Mycena epipterygia]